MSENIRAPKMKKPLMGIKGFSILRAAFWEGIKGFKGFKPPYVK